MVTRPCDVLIPVDESEFVLALPHAPAEVTRRRLVALEATLAARTPPVAISAGPVVVERDEEALAELRTAVNALERRWESAEHRADALLDELIRERRRARRAQAALEAVSAERFEARVDAELRRVELEAIRERLPAA